MKTIVALIILLLIPSTVLAQDFAKDRRPVFEILEDLIDDEDFLSARLFLRKATQRTMSLQEKIQVRNLLLQTPQVGSDLVFAWDRWTISSLAASTGSEAVVSKQLDQADQYMISKNFSAAFQYYNQIATALVARKKALEKDSGRNRTVIDNIDLLYPFVLESLGRSLYGLKKYDDAIQVFSWIPISFPRYRQVLFERMWAAFKAGKVDVALGSIASQRSSYFSDALEPESYLIQIYLFKQLCRDADLKRTVEEIRAIQNRIKSGKFTLRDWAKSEEQYRALLDLASMKIPKEDTYFPFAELQAEQKRVESELVKRFNLVKPRMLEHLELSVAYSQLAIAPGADTGLKPLPKVPGRDQLLASGLEIWPAESNEEWADEIGTHRYIGESLCVRR